MSFLKKSIVAVLLALTAFSGGAKSLLGLAAQAGEHSREAGSGATCEK